MIREKIANGSEGNMKPTIIVSGLTRCGSSLMMQMLYAGGCPVSCYPGNELISGEHDDQLSALKTIALGLTDGKAIKCLDPHRFPLPPGKEYDPKGEAGRVAEFLKDIVALDVDKMTSVVIDRSTDCYKGMLEAELIRRVDSNRSGQ